jgi:hypothetical protein
MIYDIFYLTIYAPIMGESVYIIFFKHMSILLYRNNFGYFWQRFCILTIPPIILPSRAMAHE